MFFKWCRVTDVRFNAGLSSVEAVTGKGFHFLLLRPVSRDHLA